MNIYERYLQTSRLLGSELALCAFSNEPAVVQAASASGAVGVLGATRMWPDDIAATIERFDSALRGRPYCINLATPKGMPESDDREILKIQIPSGHHAFIEMLREKYDVPRTNKPHRKFPRTQPMTDRQLQVVLDSKAPIVALALGTSLEMVARLHDAGKLVISLVGTPSQARKVVDYGADIVVAQGADAAAHTGKIGTFSLVPSVVDEIGHQVPVLAAGGITTGRHMAAALALGASGFWSGTSWLLTEENNTIPALARKLLAAGAEDTVILRADSGKPQRNVRTAWSDEWSAPGAPDPLKMPVQHVLIDDLIDDINEFEIDPLVHYPAGQGIGLIKEVTSVAKRIATLRSEMLSAIEGMQPLASQHQAAYQEEKTSHE